MAGALRLILVAGMVTLAATGCATKVPVQESLDSLVAAERAFSRLAGEIGVRDSFLATFAEDGIGFYPHPARTCEVMGARPQRSDGPRVTLSWEPVFADVSSAGDLGYTTGPFTLTVGEPGEGRVSYGYYFSVWRRQPDATWKVVLDAGIQTPGPETGAPSLSSPLPVTWQPRPGETVEECAAGLLAIEQDLAAAATTGGGAAVLVERLGEDARLHREGMMPILGREAVAAQYRAEAPALKSQATFADVAASMDLGYSYGSYERPGPGGSPAVERGYFVRVWKRDAGGEWRVVLETNQVLPEGR